MFTWEQIEVLGLVESGLAILMPWPLQHKWCNANWLKLWNCATFEKWMEKGESNRKSMSKQHANVMANMQHDVCTLRNTKVQTQMIYPDGVPYELNINLKPIDIAEPDGTVKTWLLTEEVLKKETNKQENRRKVSGFDYTTTLVSVFDSGGEVLVQNPAAKMYYETLSKRGKLDPTKSVLRAILRSDKDFQQLLRTCSEEMRGEWRKEISLPRAERKSTDSSDTPGSDSGSDQAAHTWHDFRAAYAQDPVTGKVSIIVTQSDVTEVKELQEKVFRLKEERYKQVSIEKDRFFAGVSHELRTPLLGINGLSDALLKDELAGATVNDVAVGALQQINNCGERLLELVNDILDMGKINEKKTELFKNRFDFAKAVKEVCNMLKHARDKKRQRRIISEGVKLLNECESIMIEADRKRVVQIITNLCSNACKFTKKGKVTVSCEVTGDGQYLKVCVADTGIGIKEKYLDKIFTVFEQVDNRGSREYAGTGLGLPLCEGLVKLHGGRIWVESVFGKGSKFYFTLPLKFRPVAQGNGRDAKDLSEFEQAELDAKERGSAKRSMSVVEEGRSASGEAAERKRKEAEEAERKRKEAEEAERKRKEAEEAERKRKEAEEAERKRKEAEEAERRRRVAAKKRLADSDASTDEEENEALRNHREKYALHNDGVTSSTRLDDFSRIDTLIDNVLAHSIRRQTADGELSPADDAASPTSTKRLEVPRAQDHPGLFRLKKAESAGPAAAAADDEAEQKGIVKTILSVDDDPVNQMVITNMLKREGYRVVQAMNGLEALDIIKDRFQKFEKGIKDKDHKEPGDWLPDVVLLDVNMPGMTGYKVAEQLRCKYPTRALPIIMLSAQKQSSYIVRGLHAGANDYVAKPFRKVELLARVRTQIQLKRVWQSEMHEAEEMRLLHRMLPLRVTQRLLRGEHLIADEYKGISVLFAEIVGFHELATTMSTPDLILLLNEIFRIFDRLAEKCNVRTVKSLGATYMAVTGNEPVDEKSPKSDTDNTRTSACNLVRFARCMLKAISKITHSNGRRLQLVIGVDSGPAYAGVVGVKVPSYSFYGKTVSQARLLKNLGVPSTVQVSATTQNLCAELTCKWYGREWMGHKDACYLLAASTDGHRAARHAAEQPLHGTTTQPQALDEPLAGSAARPSADPETEKKLADALVTVQSMRDELETNRRARERVEQELKQKVQASEQALTRARDDLEAKQLEMRKSGDRTSTLQTELDEALRQLTDARAQLAGAKREAEEWRSKDGKSPPGRRTPAKAPRAAGFSAADNGDVELWTGGDEEFEATIQEEQELLMKEASLAAIRMTREAMARLRFGSRARPPAQPTPEENEGASPATRLRVPRPQRRVQSQSVDNFGYHAQK